MVLGELVKVIWLKLLKQNLPIIISSCMMLAVIN